MGAPKNLGVDTFPDPVGHFGPPSGHLGFCRQCCVEDGELVPPAPIGWYFTKSFFHIIFPQLRPNLFSNSRIDGYDCPEHFLNHVYVGKMWCYKGNI